MISLIAAVGKNRELGKNGDLVFHLKKDMAFFKQTTFGHKVVMGRKTWESLPRKLAGRENIVASRGMAAASEMEAGVASGAVSKTVLKTASETAISTDSSASKITAKTGVASEKQPDLVIADLEQFLTENRDTEEEIFVIGGASVYKKALPFSRKIYLTEIAASAEADVFFPEFDPKNYVRKVLDEGEEAGLKFQFVEYDLKEGR